MIRSIGGVLLGVVGWVAIAILGNWVLRVVLPGYSQVEETMAFTLPMQIGRVALGLVASLGAGALCAVVAGLRLVPPGVLEAILVALFLPAHYKLWDKFPVWYDLFFVISLAPAVLAGALLEASSSSVFASARPTSPCARPRPATPLRTQDSARHAYAATRLPRYCIDTIMRPVVFFQQRIPCALQATRPG
jgi:hypothetical protein